jgi:hypothetical protein
MGWDARLLAALLLATLACATKPPEPPMPRVSSVLLAPISFNQKLPDLLEPGAPSVHELVSGALWEQDIRVDSPPLAEFDATWRAEAKSIGTLYGPDGKLDPTRYDAAVRELVTAYRARGTQFDALVITYLAMRPGVVTGQSVAWDGVVRNLPLEYKNRDRGHIQARRGLSTRCTSVQVLVYDAEGNRLFDRFGGLEVAQRMQIVDDNWRWTERGDLFRNRKDLEEGVRVALQPLFRD